jgi:hypothetical protein
MQQSVRAKVSQTGYSTYRGECHSFAAAAQGEDLSGQKPWHRSPGDAVYNVIQHDESILTFVSMLVKDILVRATGW